ncbi:uncharacterized protein LOC144005384 [Festucalex cinctus]
MYAGLKAYLLKTFELSRPERARRLFAIQGLGDTTSTKHGVEHHIETVGPPVHAKARRLNPDRAAVNTVQLGLDFSRMAADQASDRGTQLLRSSDTGLQVERVAVDDSGVELWCDVSLGWPRPLVPSGWQRAAFDMVHGLSHPGRKASSRLVAQKFVWSGLKKDVRAWVDSCVACQRAKVHRHTKAPLETFVVPARKFDHVNVDIVGPLPPSQGFTYLLTMVDRTTRWPEAVPLTSISTSDVARAFIGTWVARFGPPADLSSDRGAQFTSEVWNSIAEGLGFKLHRTSAYHPQANGLCERFHRSMKAALRAGLSDGNWVDKLPWIMLGLRTAPKEDLQCSSAELVYGQVLRVPGDFIPDASTPWPAPRPGPPVDAGGAFRPVPTSQHGTPVARVPPNLQSAEFVFIRHDAHRGPLSPPYDGPFRVLQHVIPESPPVGARDYSDVPGVSGLSLKSSAIREGRRVEPLLLRIERRCLSWNRDNIHLFIIVWFQRLILHWCIFINLWDKLCSSGVQ